MHDLAVLRHINRKPDETTLADHLNQQLNNKPRDTRVAITQARIARDTARMRKRAIEPEVYDHGGLVWPF